MKVVSIFQLVAILYYLRLQVKAYLMWLSRQIKWMQDWDCRRLLIPSSLISRFMSWGVMRCYAPSKRLGNRMFSLEERRTWELSSTDSKVRAKRCLQNCFAMRSTCLWLSCRILMKALSISFSRFALNVSCSSTRPKRPSRKVKTTIFFYV